MKMSATVYDENKNILIQKYVRSLEDAFILGDFFKELSYEIEIHASIDMMFNDKHLLVNKYTRNIHRIWQNVLEENPAKEHFLYNNR